MVYAGFDGGGLAPVYPTGRGYDNRASADVDWGTALLVALPVMLIVVAIGCHRRRRRTAATASVPASARRKSTRKAEPVAAATAPAATPTQRFFSPCGKPQKPGARFCRHCGARLHS
jgi:hypothetical protein